MAFSKSTTTSSLLALSFFMGATANACQSTATAETKKTLTRVVQKDGHEEIEIRIENGTLTAKINGETIDASRVRKTDAGYDILAAQGVIGLEILEDLPDVDEIYLPIGGGGLAAGTVIAIKEKNPNIKVIGVQSKSFPSMYESVKQNARTTSGGERTIADGISVKMPGELTFEIIKNLIDEIVLVDDNEITKAMFLLMERMKFVIEPAGAVGLAYLISKKPSPGKKVVVVLAGGNIDMYLLGQIVDKGLAAMSRLLKLSVLLPDRPGAFKEIVDLITLANANIVEVVHDRLSSDVNAGSAAVTLNLETQGKEQAESLIKSLEENCVKFKLLT